MLAWYISVTVDYIFISYIYLYPYICINLLWKKDCNSRDVYQMVRASDSVLSGERKRGISGNPDKAGPMILS